MTAKEMQKLIGLTAVWKAPSGLQFVLWIRDVRVAYGRVQVLVTPYAGGQGEAWLDVAGLSVEEPGEDDLDPREPKRSER
jgi:hypothetical protein